MFSVRGLTVKRAFGVVSSISSGCPRKSLLDRWVLGLCTANWRATSMSSGFSRFLHVFVKFSHVNIVEWTQGTIPIIRAIQGAVCNQSHKRWVNFFRRIFDVLSGGFWVGCFFDDVFFSLVEDCGANPAHLLEESVGLNDFGNCRNPWSRLRKHCPTSMAVFCDSSGTKQQKSTDKKHRDFRYHLFLRQLWLLGVTVDGN